MSQEFSFNLVDEPWIPCIKNDGTQVILNLQQVMSQAHKIRVLAGDTPLITAALHRFLLTILHRVFGPDSEDEWAELWKEETWDMASINGYLEKWKSHFDLFDSEHPFYQSPDERMKTKSTISLSHDRSSGNNPTLFDHHTEEIGEALTPAQAAHILLTVQSFGLAGLSGISRTFTDGTMASGIIFLVQGNNLKETLMLNMIQYPPDELFQNIHTRDDKPSWEMDDPFYPDRTNPFGYLDYLTWQNRKVLLFPEETQEGVVVKKMTMGPALRYDASILDPMKNYRIHDKLGPLNYSFSEDRVFWRNSSSLFAFSDEMSKKAIPPATLRWLHSLIKELGVPRRDQTYSTLVLGMSKKQAKVFFFRQEQLPISLDYLINEILVEKLDNAIALSGTVAFDLVQTSRLLGMYQQVSTVEEKGWHKQWAGLNVNAKSSINDWITHTGMERNYWANLDIPFQAFIIELPRDEEKALAEWYARLRKSAWSSFELATQSLGNDARSFKAMVKGESYLRYRLNEVLPKIEKEKTL